MQLASTESTPYRRPRVKRMVELVVGGYVPSKKNLLKLTRSGHGYYDKETKERLTSIENQIHKQWMAFDVPRPPMVHPAIAMVFYVVEGSSDGTRSDRDNKYTTVLDALVGAGVLKDDCIAQCNAPMLIGRAVATVGTTGVRIFLDEGGNFDRLWRTLKRMDLDDYQTVKAAQPGYRFPKP